MTDYSLYVILGPDAVRGQSPVEVARAAIRGGATVLQLRAKNASALEFFREAEQLRALTREERVPLIINDRVDIAQAVDAEGVHLGQDDLPLETARQLLGASRLIGISAGTVAEARAAERGGADYIGVGSIFATSSKADAGAPIGVEKFREIARAVHIPAVAIGGISIANAAQVMEADAAGLAVISAVTGAVDVERAARELRDKIRNGSRR